VYELTPNPSRPLSSHRAAGRRGWVLLATQRQRRRPLCKLNFGALAHERILHHQPKGRLDRGPSQMPWSREVQVANQPHHPRRPSMTHRLLRSAVSAGTSSGSPTSPFLFASFQPQSGLAYQCTSHWHEQERAADLCEGSTRDDQACEKCSAFNLGTVQYSV